METSNFIRRPILRYLGGKFRIAPWIISFFPEHKTYVECFGGGGSVLLRKERSSIEVYNDLNDSVVNVFRVLRDRQKATELQRRLFYTPYSRTEFLSAYKKMETDDDIERARKLIVRSQMAVGSAGATRESRAGFLSVNTQSIASTYNRYRKEIDRFTERLENVLIENTDAQKLLTIYDHKDTLFYCDPPYVPETWNESDRNKVYGDCAYSLEDHENLCKRLLELKGMAIVSGYDNELYNDMFHGWRKESIQTMNQKSESRTEVIWISPNCTPRKNKNTLDGFM